EVERAHARADLRALGRRRRLQRLQDPRAARDHRSRAALPRLLRAHPRRAAATVLAMIALLSGVWAGMGVDGTVRWIAQPVVLTPGTVARRAQSGQLQQYLFATAAALVAILFFVVLRGQG